MPILGGIADDITGATTTAVLLARSGVRATVCLRPACAQEEGAQEEAFAVLIQTGSRALPRAQAYQRVHDAAQTLKGMGVRYFQKRIDTTLRGAIGAEIDAMLDVLEDAVAVVVPTMPESRRILVGGYSIIDGVALVNTPAAQDVRTPVKECYIPGLLRGQTERSVAHIGLETVLAGSDRILQALREVTADGTRIVVVDAISRQDVEEIAGACIASGREILSVDPGAFTAALARGRGLIRQETGDLPDTPAEVPGKAVLIAAGSATPVTKRQMEVLEQQGRCRRLSLDPGLLMDGGQAAEGEIRRAVETAAESLHADAPPREILFETALHGSLLDLAAEEAQRGLAPGKGAEAINEALGRIAALVMDQAEDKIAGIYATGGDTLLSVCGQLGSDRIEVTDYVIPQADVARLTGRYAGLPVIGKGGLTGSEKTAVQIVDRLFMEYGRARSEGVG